MIRLLSPHHGYVKSHWSPFAAQPLSKVCCTSIAAYVRGPALVLVPNLASKVKMVGFSDDRGYGTLLWWKRQLPTNITIICTVHTVTLHPYWGSAKKRLYKIFKAFINTSRCERRLLKWETHVCTMQLPGRNWNAKRCEWQYLGAHFIIHFAPLHCFTLLMNSKWADAMPGCWQHHSLHVKSCQIVALSRSTPKTV
jgi:hypothetical protein